MPPISRFALPLRLEYLDGRTWQLTDAFTFGSVVLERVVVVPVGFLTDFASIPRLLWRVLPPTGRYGKAAVIHDFCYRTPFYVTRAQADQVFNEAMQDLGVARLVRWIMYWGVRLGGRRAWKGASAVRVLSLAEAEALLPPKEHP